VFDLRGAIVGCLAVSLLATACSAPSTRPAARSGEAPAAAPPTRIVASIRAAPAGLHQQKTNPAGLVGSVSGLDALEELVHAGLVHGDDQGNRLPQLAEAVPTLENGLWSLLPDGRMTTSWRIKPSAQWHDGTPVTSSDFVFAAGVEQNPELGIPRNPVYDIVEAIDTPDAQTITVSWKRPYIEADGMFTYDIGLPLPRHLLEKSYTDDPAGFLGLPYWTQEFVGAGPYRIREWVADSHVVLQANERYILGKPKIDEIEVRFVPEATTMMANLLAGTIDLTIGRALSLEQAIQLRDKWKDGSMATKGGSWVRVTPQFINPNPTVITDVRFRRALLHAVDRQQLVESLMGGLGGIAHTFVGPDTPEYQFVEGRMTRYDYDPRRAVQLIEEIGYTRGGDGFFHDSSGQQLVVELRGPIQNPVHPKAVAAIADYWQAVGVRVDQLITPIQRAQDREFLTTYPGFELILIGNDVSSKGVRRYHSSSTPLPENRYLVNGNEARYRNADLDALIDRYVSTIPMDERMGALAGIVAHQTQNVTVMGMIYSVTPTVFANRIQHITAGRAGAARSTEAWNAHEWTVN